MTSSDIRKSFLEFFSARNHVIVPSSSLLPDDPSVLLTTAGMQQFKPYYTGAADPLSSPHPTLSGKPLGARNAASAQKSFRTSDIDEVGDESHDTFFEMLGNFSFGGYFKKESIQWAHEFITKELGLNIDYVTVFGGDKEVPLDEESMKVWQALGVKDVRKAGREDNFWGPTGKEGPCGPTTEIYINGVEIWNIVFNEYFCHEDKRFEKLKISGIDTGMGLERLAMVVQKVPTIFDTDLFKPLIEMMLPPSPGLRSPSPRGRGEGEGNTITRSLRIVADHMRGATFLMADGVRPSNLDRGYVLRRVIRRAIRHASLLKLPHGMLLQLIGKVVDMYGGAYPELTHERNNVLETFTDEEKKFARAVEQGMREFERIIKNKAKLLPAAQHKSLALTGDDAFHLFDTYGFPLELTREIAAERGLTVDEAGFQKAFEAHQEKSRAGAVGKFGGHGLILDTGELKAATAEDVKIVTRLHTATHMLHKALREVLGRHVQQQGSDITAQRLRFDFTHPKKLSAEEIKRLSDLVNEKIKEDLAVTWQEMTYDEAIAQGALAFFKEKYPPQVKVYSVGDFSKEICGGPHVTRSAEIGRLKIVKEESCGAGVRRIRAVVE